MADITTKSNIIENSMPDHVITAEEFQENTIIRRLKGLQVWDPTGRDIGHPAVRKEENGKV